MAFWKKTAKLTANNADGQKAEEGPSKIEAQNDGVPTETKKPKDASEKTAEASVAPRATKPVAVETPAVAPKAETAAAYDNALALSAHNSARAAHDHFANLAPLVRISGAVFIAETGVLEVNGWCLTPDARFELFLEVRGTAIYKTIEPNTEERKDVFQEHIQYGNKNSGWRVRIPVRDLPEGATARIVYVSSRAEAVNNRPIARIDPPPRVSPAPQIRLTKADYSASRCLLMIEGAITNASDAPKLSLRLSSGAEAESFDYDVGPANGDGVRNFVINARLGGIVDKEEAIVVDAERPAAKAARVIGGGADSPRRLAGSRATIQQNDALMPNSLMLSDMLDLRRQLIGRPKVARKAGTVCYFPPFAKAEDLADHYHRASWYLTGSDSPISSVVLGCAGGLPAERASVLPPPPHFGTARLDDGALTLTPEGDAYLQALMTAGAILVWRPVPRGLMDYFKRLVGKVEIITVATHDPAAVEYGNYCRAPWLALPKDKKAALLNESQQRFRNAIEAQRAAGKTCSAVLGTGPSIDSAFGFDFSECMAVACNSIVGNDALLDHIRPAFVCAGDAVSHFGVSSYAETFRADLIRALTTRDIHFLTSAAIGYLLIQKHPEIRDRVIVCEQKFTGLNARLEDVWALPKYDSTLNIHMLPIAASFSDTIYMLGLDGRSPNPADNEDFWAHSKSAQYHDLVDSGHLTHPTFAINRAQATEERYIASVEDSLMSGEVLGKVFYSLAESYTPGIHARPAPPHCFASQAEGAPRRLRPLARPAAAAEGGPRRRALIVSQVTRRHFSGGRYHVTMLAEAMAAFCDEVVVWANNMPPWSGDLGFCPDHGKVRYVINNHIDGVDGRFDYVVMAPDGAPVPTVPLRALEVARESNARTAFLNFESPNWFNALSPAPKKLADFGNWFAAACFSDVILSSCETALPFARSFYKTLFHEPVFAVAPPSINAPIADLVLGRNLPREKQIILISRFGDASAHKNIDAIFDLLVPEMSGYTLALIAGTSDLPSAATLIDFESRLTERGLTLKLLHMISDRRKFEEIAKSELMIFPSLFEGFGYPPVEAGYMGTPCVAYDLPALTEFSGDSGYFAPWGDVAALRAEISHLLTLPFEQRVRTADPQVRRTATIAAFGENLRRILAEEDTGGRAAANFTKERFELAAKVYVDGCLEPRLTYGLLSRSEVGELAERYRAYNRVIEESLSRLRALSGAPA
jgi:glycosyltransferase involved in cell wall biosynthesis